MGARLVARRRRLQRQPRQRAHLPQRRLHPGLRDRPVLAQLRAERFQALEVRPGIAVDSHFADARLEQVDPQHAGLEQRVVELDLRTRVAVAFVFREQRGGDSARAGGA